MPQCLRRTWCRCSSGFHARSFWCMMMPGCGPQVGIPNARLTALRWMLLNNSWMFKTKGGAGQPRRSSDLELRYRFYAVIQPPVAPRLESFRAYVSSMWHCIYVCMEYVSSIYHACMHACMHVMSCHVMSCHHVVCVCAHVCVHACMHVGLYACLYACMHVCRMYARMHAFDDVCMKV